MRQCVSRQQVVLLVQVMVLTVVAGVCGPRPVGAQPGDLGVYSGTIELSGTRVDPQVSYRASAKVVLPVSDRDDSSITAEFLSGEAPNARVSISEWEESHTEKFADMDGKFNSWKCSLAAPAEVEMTTTGVLNVDLDAKTHMLSVTFLSTETLAFNCVHSRSGPYQKDEGIVLSGGTGLPGMQWEHPLPFSDPARLSAKYTLMPTADTKDEYGPIVQEWDLRLTR